MFNGKQNTEALNESRITELETRMEALENLVSEMQKKKSKKEDEK